MASSNRGKINCNKNALHGDDTFIYIPLFDEGEVEWDRNSILDIEKGKGIDEFEAIRKHIYKPSSKQQND